MTPTQNDTGGGILFTTNLKYLRITNLDSTNEVALTIQNDSTEEYMVKLEGGHSYVLFNSKINANAAGDSSVSYGGLTDIDKILAKAQGATCQVEVFSALS
jgi:predicted secreted protein